MSEQQPWQQWEEEVAKIVGMQRVSQSGAGVYKLDVGGQTLVISCKDSEHDSIRITKDMIQELRYVTTGIGGVGAQVTPLMAIRFAGVELVGLGEFTDIINLLKSEVRMIPPTKDEARRARADVPELLRDA